MHSLAQFYRIKTTSRWWIRWWVCSFKANPHLQAINPNPKFAIAKGWCRVIVLLIVWIQTTVGWNPVGIILWLCQVSIFRTAQSLISASRWTKVQKPNLRQSDSKATTNGLRKTSLLALLDPLSRLASKSRSKHSFRGRRKQPRIRRDLNAHLTFPLVLQKLKNKMLRKHTPIPWIHLVLRHRISRSTYSIKICSEKTTRTPTDSSRGRAFLSVPWPSC